VVNVFKTDVWSAPISDQPGGLVSTIEDLVLKGSLDLQFLLAQRSGDDAGKGSVLLLPLVGERQQAIAQHAGFVRNDRIFCLRVTGNDEPGIAYRLLKALAIRGLNLRAVSATAVSDQFVMYLALDSATDADIATKVLMSPV
jgi:hypothetical protein